LRNAGKSGILCATDPADSRLHYHATVSPALLATGVTALSLAQKFGQIWGDEAKCGGKEAAAMGSAEVKEGVDVDALIASFKATGISK